MRNAYRSFQTYLFAFLQDSFRFRRDCRARRTTDRQCYLDMLEPRVLLSAVTVSDITETGHHNTTLSFSLVDFTNAFADTSGGSLTQIEFTSLPTSGSMTLGGSAVTINQTISTADVANLIYTPNSNYQGSDIIGWNASNGAVFADNPANILVAVNESAPVVSDVAKFIATNTTTAFQASDFAPAFTSANSGDNNNPQVIEIMTLPANGTLMLNGQPVSTNQTISVSAIDGTSTGLSYVPNTNFTGADSFSWNASDGTDFAANPANVNLTVSNTPVVSDITKTTHHNSTLSFNLIDFTNAFADASGASLTQIEFTALPTHGSLTLSHTLITLDQVISTTDVLNLTYWPSTNFSGSDVIGWNASDGTVFAGAPANINITVVENAPTVSDVTKTAAKNISTAFAASDFTPGFSDPDAGDTLQAIQITSLPAHGTLKLNGSTGSVPTAVTIGQTLSVSQIPNLVYVATSGYLGSDTFNWTASDGSLFASASAAMNLTVADSPPVLSAINLVDRQNTTLALTTANFTSAFTDANGDSLVEIAITGLPTYGTLSLSGKPVYEFQVIPLNQLNKLTYTPGKNFAGKETISWSASDGQKYASSASTLNISVGGMAPTVAPIAKGVLENATSMAFSAWDFTNAFTEPNVGPILQSITISSLPTHGTLTLNGSAVSTGQVITATQISTLSYRPGTGYVGTDVWGWKASDGINTSASASTLTITVVSSASLVVSTSGGVIPTGSTSTSLVNFTDLGQTGIVANINGSATARLFTITNNTPSTITLTGGANKIQFLGNSNDFSATDFTDTLTNATLSALTPGESAHFTIALRPRAIGARAATAVIPVSSGAAYKFAVTGTGLNTFDNNSTASQLYGLQYATLQAGTGAGAAEGDILTMNYTGYLLDGTLFDSSLNPGRTPFQFELGGQQVITGWDPGLIGIQQGEKRILIIPPSLGYGNNGQGTIPGHATLVFIVQCLGIGVPRVGAGVTNNSNYITPMSTTASTIEGTNFGALTATQSSFTQSFSLYSLGYSFVSQGVSGPQTTTAGLYFTYLDSSTNYTDNSQVVLSGINAANFSLAHSANTGSFTVTFNKPGDTAVRKAVVTIYTSDGVNPAFSFAIQANAAPYVDLTPTLGTTNLPAATITSGDRTNLALPITITNNGNVATAGTANISIYALNVSSHVQTLITTLTNQSLGGIAAHGGTKAMTLNASLPVGFAAGTYDLVVQLNPTSAIVESTYTNNTATTTQAITVNQGLADLTGTLVSTTVPATIVSNTTINSSITVSVTNQGNVLLPANQQVTIQIIAHNTGTSANTTLTTSGPLNVNSLAIAGVSKFTIPFKYNAGLPAGNYILEALVSPVQTLAESSLSNNLITQNASSQQLTVLSTSPFYDLTPTIGTTHLPTTITSGDRTVLSLPLTIRNWGNVTSAGSSDIQIFALNTSTQAQTVIATLTGQNLGGIGANGTTAKTLTLTTTLPIGFSAGTYELGVLINGSQAIPESNYSNDTATTTQTIAVNQGLADLTGAIVSDTLPPAIVANASISASLTVQVANLGNVLLPANQQITIQVLAHDTGSSQNTVLTTSGILSIASLKTGVSKFTLPIQFVPGLPSSNYILEAQINPVQPVAESNTSNNLITTNTSGQNIALLSASPFNNLGGNLGSSTLPTTKLHGTALTGTVNIVVSNLGNLALPANQQVTLSLVAHSAGGDIPLKSGLFSVFSLAPGASKTLGLAVNLPGGLTAGSYTLQATITPVQTLSESSTADNLLTLNGAGAAIPLTIT